MANFLPSEIAVDNINSAVIFLSYIALFTFQGILVKASQSVNYSYDYSTVATVLITELLKAIISIAIYLSKSSHSRLFYDLTHNLWTFGYYLIPALLYSVYNNLAFINLQCFDPTTYYLLLQLRVVITGILYQCFFRKKLTYCQWFSLIILTIGCMVKQWAATSNTEQDDDSKPSFFQWNMATILLQVLSSCIAGVYNEYLLKSTGSNMNIMMVHNIYLYVASIIMNIIILLIWSHSNFNTVSIRLSSFANMLRPTIIILMLNNALGGVVTSFFLKSLNSILKTFAAALELSLSAVLCYFIFLIPIDSFTILSISLVSYATWLYIKDPIVTEPLSKESFPVKYTQLKNKHDQRIDKFIKVEIV